MTLDASHRVCCTGTFNTTPLRTKVEACAAAGFHALSVRPRQLDEEAAAGNDLAVVRAWFDGAGLAVAEVDPVNTWLPGDTHDLAATVAVLDAAVALDADCVTVLWLPGLACTHADAVAGFAELCALAAEHDVRLGVEFFPWSPVPSLHAARQLVETVTDPHVGYIVDLWHHARSGGTTSELAALDGARVFGIQVADGPAAPAHPDVAEECRHHRRFIDDGELPVRTWIDALRDAGCDAPLAIEVFDGPGPTIDPFERARVARASLERLYEPAPPAPSDRLTGGGDAGSPAPPR